MKICSFCGRQFPLLPKRRQYTACPICIYRISGGYWKLCKFTLKQWVNAIKRIISRFDYLFCYHRSEGDGGLTVSDLLSWVANFGLSGDTKIYVQMPENITKATLEKANVGPIKLFREDGAWNRYARAFGPCLRYREHKRNLYIDIYY